MQNFKSTSNAQYLAQKHYGIIATAKGLAGHEDHNFQLKTQEGQSYVLKISQPDSNLENLEMQNAAMVHLAKQHLSLALPQMIPNLDGNITTLLVDENGKKRTLRLLTWVEGRVFSNVNPHTSELLKSLGQSSALLCKGLENFEHSGAHRLFQWDSTQVLWVKEHVDKFKNSETRELIEYFLQLFESLVIPRLPTLRKSIIHNDLNDFNILVNDHLVNPKISGIIDFGDAVFTHMVNDLAIACAYAIMDKPDPILAAQHIVLGFHENHSLSENEVEVLFPLIAARLLVSVTSSTLNRIEEPDNEYLYISEKPAWDLLKKVRKISPNFAHYAFRNACGWEPSKGKSLIIG